MTEQQPPTVCQHGSLQRACLVCEVTAERDTALQRAEQAEAALAQAMGCKTKKRR